MKKSIPFLFLFFPFLAYAQTAGEFVDQITDGSTVAQVAFLAFAVLTVTVFTVMVVKQYAEKAANSDKAENRRASKSRELF